MLDMHCHYLPNVDDGFKNREEALERLEQAIADGCDKIVFTPHYFPHRYEAPKEKIQESYAYLTAEIEKAGLHCAFYLGREIYYKPYIIDELDKKEIETMGNTAWVLVEFNPDHEPEESLSEIAYRFYVHHYQLIVAHVERYGWMTFDRLKELRAEGAYLQVNADSLMGEGGFRMKRFAKKAVKMGLISFIGSDLHSFRKNKLKEAYEEYGSLLLPNTFEEDLKKANP